MPMNPMIETIENEDGSITTRIPDNAKIRIGPFNAPNLFIFCGSVGIIMTITMCLLSPKPLPQEDPFVQGPKEWGSKLTYMSIDGLPQRLYQPSEGTITYCEPDHLRRPTCAYALLTPENREVGKNHQRQEIAFNPTGWPSSNTALDNSEPFWVKTPMIGTQLGGDITSDNTITGTQRLNESGYAHEGNSRDGLRYAEYLAKTYLDDPYNEQCPLYYAVTPHYVDEELIPRNITIDIESCDQTLSKHMTIENVVGNHTINYHTGETH